MHFSTDLPDTKYVKGVVFVFFFRNVVPLNALFLAFYFYWPFILISL